MMNAEPPSPAPNDDAGLRALAQRLLTSPFQSYLQPPQLLVGHIPPNLPIELPLPPGAVTLGSLTGTRVTVALDAPQDAPTVFAFYRERLGALGWREPEPPFRGQPGGFVSGGAFGETQAAFYASPSGPSLTVTVRPTEQAPTDVRLELNPDAQQRHTPFLSARRMERDLFSLLPQLTPPPHARQTDGGGGSSSEDWLHTSARLDTWLDPSAVAAHYNAQLAHAGWAQTGTGADASVAWSAWTFTPPERAGEQWRGMLLVSRYPDAANRYMLMLQAELASAGEGGDVWGERSGKSQRPLGPVVGWQSHTIVE